MKFSTPSIISLISAILLPLGLSAAPEQRIADSQSPTEDNITLMMTPVEDATTAFINLDNPVEGFASGGNDALASEIIDFAEQYLGRPYRSGGKGPKSFDCSGFTSYIFSKFDISLSASSRTQYGQGEHINLEEVRPGDLLFFSGHRGGKSVGHVAMAVDVNEDGSIRFIHASNSKGITYDTYPDGGYYSQRYLGARRVIE